MNLIGVNLNLGGEIVRPLPPKWARCNFDFIPVSWNTSWVYMNIISKYSSLATKT